MKFDRKYVKYIAAGVLAVGIIAVPVSAAMVATDKPLSGASVVVDEYCNQVANGAVTSAAVSATPEPVVEEPQPTAAPEETKKEDEHVKLNLNYSRLGVATKVEKVIKKQKISKEAIKRAGGMDAINADLANWVCVTVDDDYAFVAKEFVEEQYSLKRAVKVGTVSASSSDGVSEGQASIVEYAKQFLGNRYVWGGASLTHGTDCSGFTMSLYAKYGHSLPHNAAAQAGVTRKVSSPKPGDLFFYSNGSRINHVAMYIGSGLVIHASNPSDGIKISNAYYRHPVKIGRVMN